MSVQWAKERFEEYFEKPAEVVNSYLSQPNFVEAAKQSGETSQLLKIKSYLVENKPLGFDECIVWARQQFETEFSNEIKQLLFSLPKDLVSLLMLSTLASGSDVACHSADDEGGHALLVRPEARAGSPAVRRQQREPPSPLPPAESDLTRPCPLSLPTWSSLSLLRTCTRSTTV